MKIIIYALYAMIYLPIYSLQALEVPNELLQWAHDNPVATVGIDDDFPPFDYIDENGQPTGVGELVRQQLSDILPIDIEVVSQGPFATQLEKLSQKKINMLSVCSQTLERAKSMLFTSPFLSLTPIVAVHKKSAYHSVEDILKTARIAVPKGYATIRSALSIVNQDNIVEVSNTLAGLELVNSGQVEGVVTYLSVKNYFVQKHGFANLQALPITGGGPSSIGFCVDKQYPQLVALLNEGIDLLGSDYFNHLEAEWVASLNNIDVKSSENNTWLKLTIFISILILILLIFLIHRHAEIIANKFETVKFKFIYSFVLIFMFVSIFSILDYYFDTFKVRIIEDQKESFNITKEAVIKSVDDWYEPRLKILEEVVRAPLFQSDVRQLVSAVKKNNMALKRQQVHWLTEFFNTRPYLTEKGRQYEIILPDAQVLFSSRSKAQKHSAIRKYYPKLFARALAGESIFIPSIDIGEQTKFPVVYIVKPILTNKGEVIAMLAVSFEANGEFSSLFNDVRLGFTVESYAINLQGYLLSESRFINQLHSDNVVPFGKSSILRMSIAETKGSPVAHDMRFKIAGRNLAGYQDYMGHTVAGQWTWIEKYNFMLVSEVSLDEMYFEHTTLRNILLIAMVLSIALFTAISLFMMIISHRASQMNRLSKENLEELVDKRTQALGMSEQKNSLIVNSVADGILGLDTQGKVVFFNHAAEQMLGHKEVDIVGKNYQNVLYSCKSERVEQEQQKMQIKNSIVDAINLHVAEDYFCHIDGHDVPVAYNLSVIDDENSPFKAVITFQDISLRLLESQRTSALLASVPAAIFLLSRDKKVVEINAATEELLGYQKEEIIGKDFSHFIPADRLKEHKVVMERCFKAFKYMRMGHDKQVTMQKKSGVIIEIDTIFTPMELNGEQMAVISMLDITEVNQRKRLLVEAKEFADDASRSKSDFLANMSHEIRTPMNAIIGMSMLALQGVLAPKERNYVNKVHFAATNLLGIINDILDFSKVESGKLELENKKFALAELLDNFSTVVSLKTQEKGVDLLFHIAPDVPLFFIGDLLRLNQVLINLGGNAIKFTEEGEIILNASISEINNERIKLLFSIKDTGVGIKSELLKKLFVAFSQADASTTRKYGGTGLGLSISKRLVELMGGDIWAESIAGQGSEFFFTAWLTADKKDKSLQILETAQARLTGKRVLIVDDSLTTLMTLKKMTEGFGCEVFTAHSGEEALLVTEKISHFDFALIDWNMPIMNGLETCDRLKKLEGVVIEHLILISAYGREQIRESDYIDRFDSLLAKPVTSQRLHQAFQSSLGYELEPEIKLNKAMNTSQFGLAGAHLLLVEDNELNQEVATAILQEAGIIVSHAAHGEIAVSMAQSNSYDAILMDIQMPVMDGYKATKLIREFNQTIPILAMTANAMSGEKGKVIEAGMNDYISKPIDVQVMFSVIKNWVNVKGDINHLVDPVVMPETYNLDSVFAHFSKINKQSGLAICNENSELYLKILIKFEFANKSFNDNFMLHWKAESWDELTRLVHSLKGGAGNIGAKTLYALLNDLELACIAPEHNIDLKVLLDKSVQELVAVIEEITLMLALLAKQQVQNAETLPSLTKSEITSKLIELQVLVDGFDTDAQKVAVVLFQGIVDQQVKMLLEDFIAQLESFDFDSANETLSQIKKMIKTDREDD